MKRYYIYFSGYFEVEAENAQDAEDRAWAAINAVTQFENDFWDIAGVEEMKE